MMILSVIGYDSLLGIISDPSRGPSMKGSRVSVAEDCTESKAHGGCS